MTPGQAARTDDRGRPRAGQCFSEKMVRFIASGFFISYIPVRLLPGTKFSGAGLWGTALAFLFVPLLPENPVFFSAFISAFLIFSIWICARASRSYDAHDDPRIVLDEIAGYWVAIAFLPREIPVLLAAFACFRILDTLKPGPIRKLDSLKGGLGVVSDDVLCGIIANLTVRAGLLLIQ